MINPTGVIAGGSIPPEDYCSNELKLQERLSMFKELALNRIAIEISELDDMPNDDSYYEACVLVAEDLYDLDYDNACKVADIIQDKYLEVIA